MPVVLPTIAGLVTTNLFATGNLGQDIPKVGTGVATGLSIWVPKIVVQTVDTGTLGVGKGTPTPLLVPNPVLLANLTTGFTSFGLLSIFVPLFITGLANGLAPSFLQMLTNTAHPTVGVGAGVARFQASPAGPDMVAGFSAAGMVGEDPTKLANAIGLGLDITFASLFLPVPIVGPASPLPGGGAGVGNII